MTVLMLTPPVAAISAVSPFIVRRCYDVCEAPPCKVAPGVRPDAVKINKEISVKKAVVYGLRDSKKKESACPVVAAWLASLAMDDETPRY